MKSILMFFIICFFLFGCDNRNSIHGVINTRYDVEKVLILGNPQGNPSFRFLTKSTDGTLFDPLREYSYGGTKSLGMNGITSKCIVDVAPNQKMWAIVTEYHDGVTIEIHVHSATEISGTTVSNGKGGNITTELMP